MDPLPLYVVNAFTTETFGGNPAAVMPLRTWLPDAALQSMAAQHNLSETAFFVKTAPGCYDLRWFTPKAEVPLCGHATLASAHVIARILHEETAIDGALHFQTRYRGELIAHIDTAKITLDLPSVPFTAHTVEPALSRALGTPTIDAVRPIHDPWQVLYRVDSAARVAALAPDIQAIAQAVDHAVIVTAIGADCDVVSRFFAPHLGVDEDPVTGSAHCLLTPYWAEQLGQLQLRARQLSSRGGEIDCELIGDRVRLGGRCVTYSVGEVVAPVV